MTNTICYLSLLLFIIACGATGTKKSSVERFPVTTPLVLDTVYSSDYVAEIYSKQNIELRTRVRGYLEHIFVDEGARVTAGQLLFTISSQEYKEELLKAQAMLKSAVAEAKSAELKVQNVKLLLDKKVVSKSELAMAEAKLEAMNAKTDEMRSAEAGAKLRLAYTEIKAPFDGVIDRLPNRAGSLVDEGTLLTTLSDNSEVYAYFNVSEKEYLAYSHSKQAQLEQKNILLILADNSVHPYKGEIETIEGEFDQGTGSIAFRARFPNPERILRHGASGKIRLKRHVKNALVIPQKATFEIQDKMYVFVVDSSQTVKMKAVISTLRLPHLYIISSGLTTSDRIVYEGTQELRDGMKIKPDYVEAKKILPNLGIY